MSAGIYVKDNGVWKLPKSIWVKSGTWRVCNNVYVKEGGSWREMIKTVDLTSNKSNFNLYSHVGSPSQPLALIFNVASNVTISSSGTTSGYRTTAFTVGNFPSGSTIIINNNGTIAGGGGARGAGADLRYGRVNGSAGGNGGYGLVKGSNNNYDCTLVNTGTVAGGGGGGGGGAGLQYSTGAVEGSYGGQGAGITGYSPTQGEAGQPSKSGTTAGIGGGGTIYGGKGGNGGSNNQNGTAGASTSQYTGGAGGKGRPAILGSGIEIAVSGNIDGGIG